jgi:membrane protease YdiL (CAAX protease family)
MIVSGALFALLHGHWMGFLPITLLGCLMAYAYDRTGSLLAPLMIHILHNSVLMSKGMVLRQLLELG